ncbi:hypothetical protein PIB30_083460, partial [Stylosanthes scabra]|nr:hypothetical protein [Stylosanthes scabra]
RWSARNVVGHGSHTTSITAGKEVKDASFYGIGKGGEPSSRLVIYQVCTFEYCGDAAVLRALDDAIEDSVDLITICRQCRFQDGCNSNWFFSYNGERDSHYPFM